MNAFEFHTTPKDGRIEIPVEYQGKIVGAVRVIVLSPEPGAVASDLIDRLLDHPLPVEGFAPLTREEIYERR